MQEARTTTNNIVRSVPNSELSCKGTKRIATMTHEQLVAYDNKRAIKEWHKELAKQAPSAGAATQGGILPLRASFLSQRLQERFAHLLN